MNAVIQPFGKIQVFPACGKYALFNFLQFSCFVEFAAGAVFYFLNDFIQLSNFRIKTPGIIFPGIFFGFFCPLFCLFLNLGDCFHIGLSRCEQPFFKLVQSIKFFFPFQAFFAFIPLVRSRGGMPLGLGEFFNVKQNRGLGIPAFCNSFSKCFNQRRVVPAFAGINFNAVGVFFFAEPGQCFRNACFGGLKLHRNTDSVSIVIYSYSHRHLHYCRCIHGFKKHSFRSAGFADGAKSYFFSGNVVVQVLFNTGVFTDCF